MMTDKWKYDVFISYASDDKDIAIELFNYLQQNSCKTFLAEQSLVGAELSTATIFEELDSLPPPRLQRGVHG